MSDDFAIKRVAILGSTGSIGRQTLDVIRQHPHRLKVVGLAAQRNVDALMEQAVDFGVQRVALFDEVSAKRLGRVGGVQSLTEVATAADVDVVVVAVAGVIGLIPTLAAIDAGKTIALASKEILVAAGEMVMPRVREARVAMTPIDSEHSAIFQCVQGVPEGGIDSVILTASGGPFRGWTRAQLGEVTRPMALAHPTWTMGGKITIDSATLFNKALETIEAHWLFGVPMERVEIVVHPQSIVHSLVRLKDQSVLAQLGWPDMRLPIQYALLHPDRTENELPRWSPLDHPTLTFEPLDPYVFEAPTLARNAMEIGRTMPCVFNAANEEAVARFLRDEISFLGIVDAVKFTMDRHHPQPVSLESLLESDQWARETVRSRRSL